MESPVWRVEEPLHRRLEDPIRQLPAQLPEANELLWQQQTIVGTGSSSEEKGVRGEERGERSEGREARRKERGERCKGQWNMDIFGTADLGVDLGV